MVRVALAGNPNCGKTTLFNAMTGSTAHVGNWPGVTVDKREGICRKGSAEISVIDLPGIYSLSPYTAEEVIARNFLLEEKPDCVINVVDATNLERNMYLTTQLLEIDVPIVIALNMADEIEKNGMKIDVDYLSKKTKVPVVLISALRGDGIVELADVVTKQAQIKRVGYCVLQDTTLNHLVGDVKIAMEVAGVENPLFHAIKLIENDEIEMKSHGNMLKPVQDFKFKLTNQTFGEDYEAYIADARYKYICANYSVAVKGSTKKKGLSKSDKADKIITSKWWGIPIFLTLLFAMFHLTFAEDFLYLGAIFSLPRIKDLALADNFGTALLTCVYDGAVFSPGVILFNLMGLLTSTISGWVVAGLESVGASEWLIGFIGDGVLAGLSGVIGFIPQIIFLLLLLSIMEDTGYMARVAFIFDRIFRRFGVSGRAFIPMIMGFGCSVPAIVNTRTLADDREKTLTIRVIPFFTCGAKLPILSAVAGATVMAFGIGNADVITYSMYVVGIALAVITIILMRSTTQRGPIAPFIMELPEYRAPSFRNLMLHLWDKTKHYIEKAFTVILASTIVIWFLSNFGWDWKMCEINNSILASIGKFVQPLFSPLGFGSQLGTYGWVFAVAAIMGLIAKENVIAAFLTMASVLIGVFATNPNVFINPDVLTPEIVEQLGILIESGDFGEEGYEVVAMIAATGIDVPGLISFIVFNMSTIPCFATVATAKGELGKEKIGKTLLFWIVTSYLASTVTYLVLKYWWTVFILLFIFAIVVFIISTYNKKRPIKEN